jgi:hypothetical protein
MVEVVAEAELGVPPAADRQLLLPVGRAGQRPVDEPDRSVLALDDVPGADVAVADDCIGGRRCPDSRAATLLQAAAGSWPWRRAEPLAAGRPGGCPRRVRDGGGRSGLDVAQDLAALVVVAVAHDPRRAGKADLLQMPKQRVHGRCPGSGRTQDRVAVADGGGGLAVGAEQGSSKAWDGIGCSSCSVVTPQDSGALPVSTAGRFLRWRRLEGGATADEVDARRRVGLWKVVQRAAGSRVQAPTATLPRTVTIMSTSRRAIVVSPRRSHAGGSGQRHCQQV